MTQYTIIVYESETVDNTTYMEKCFLVTATMTFHDQIGQEMFREP